MKITQKQLLILLQVLEDSIRINDAGNAFLWTNEYRTDLYIEILNQQDSDFIELEDLK